MWDSTTINMILEGIVGTVYMSIVSTFFGYLLGLPMGVLLTISDKNGLRPNVFIYKILDAISNLVRSVPFLILLILLIPFTRFVVGKSYGTTATIVPLVISSAPYIARMVESSLKEVDEGVIEAAKAMGSSTWQIIRKVLIPESVPSLVTGAAMAVTTILAYSAMVSAVGGGGIGAYAITKGYQRGKKYYDFMYAASAVLVLMVQVIAITGTRLTRRLDHRIR